MNKKFRIWGRALKPPHFLDENDLKNFHTSNWYDVLNGPFGIFKNNLFVVQQWTGLIDCNNKEIYEGDIIKYYDFIEYENETNENKVGGDYKEVKQNLEGYYGAYDPFTKSIDGEYGESKFEPSKCEVIGNIFKNPELIKK